MNIHTIPENAKGAPQLATILKAIQNNNLSAFLLHRGAKYYGVPKGQHSRATLHIIGDDLIDAQGPDAFHRKSLRQILRRAQHVIVYVGGPTTAIYAHVTRLALAGQRAVLVETQVSHEIEWRIFVERHAPYANITIITSEPLRYAPGGTA